MSALSTQLFNEYLIEEYVVRYIPPRGNRLLFYLVPLLILVAMTSGCSSSSVQGKQNKDASSIFTIPTHVSTPVPGLRQFIDTWNNVHLFQSFDYSIPNPAAIARYYDFVWGVSPNKVAAFRSGNSNALLSYYMGFNRDSGKFTDQQVGNQQGLSYWKIFHPDWVVYRCDRSTPALEYGDPNIPLDISNPDVVSWQVQTYAQPASEHGYDAIAADNLNMENLFGACGFYKNGQWVQRYTGQIDDPQWRADIVTWVTRMQAALHALHHPLALIPNLSIGTIPFNDPALQQVVAHVDGILDEGGFTNYGDNYVTGSNWVDYVRFIQSVQQQNRAYYLVNQFKSNTLDNAQIEWALASYFMGKGHLASVFITNTVNDVQGYGFDRRFPAYNVKIGSPEGDMYQSQGVYWRNYSNGLVVVNPSNMNTYTVKTQAPSYIDAFGNHVKQTFTLPPHFGLVLIPG